MVLGCTCDNRKTSVLYRLIFNWNTFSRQVTARWSHGWAKNLCYFMYCYGIYYGDNNGNLICALSSVFYVLDVIMFYYLYYNVLYSSLQCSNVLMLSRNSWCQIVKRTMSWKQLGMQLANRETCSNILVLALSISLQ